MFRSKLVIAVATLTILACGGGPGAVGEVCTQPASDHCVDPTSSFAPGTPVIHYVYTTTRIPAAGSDYTVQWIAVEVGDAAPAGTVIAEVPMSVADDANSGAYVSYTFTSELSMPTAGWPPGSYSVQLVDSGGMPTDIVSFSIQ